MAPHRRRQPRSADGWARPTPGRLDVDHPRRGRRAGQDARRAAGHRTPGRHALRHRRARAGLGRPLVRDLSGQSRPVERPGRADAGPAADACRSPPRTEPERSKRGADPVALDPGERPVERAPDPEPVPPRTTATPTPTAHRPGPADPRRRSTRHRARPRTTRRPWTSRCPSPRSADCSRRDWCRGWPGAAACNCRLDRSAAGCPSRPPPPSRSPWPWVAASGRSACAAWIGPCGRSPPIAGPPRPRRHRSSWPSWPMTRSNW